MNAPATTNPTELLAKLNAAVASANDAEAKATTAQTELVSRSRAVGVLLLEAKKLHPAVKDFDAFLKGVNGLHLSRAYDLLRLAGGRTTDEELKEDARLRKQKSRAKKKLPEPAPAPKRPEPVPSPVSVTEPDVTESAEPNTEKRKPEKMHSDAEERAKSAHALAEFTFACQRYLPRMTPRDRQKAFELVYELTSDLTQKAEAA